MPLRLISLLLVVCLSALQPLVLEGWPVSLPSGSFDAVHIDPAAQRRIADLSRGEPFLFQRAGECAWLAGDGHVIRDEEVVRGCSIVCRTTSDRQRLVPVRWVSCRLQRSEPLPDVLRFGGDHLARHTVQLCRGSGLVPRVSSEVTAGVTFSDGRALVLFNPCGRRWTRSPRCRGRVSAGARSARWRPRRRAAARWQWRP